MQPNPLPSRRVFLLPLVLIGGTIVVVALFRPGGLKSMLPRRAAG